MITNHPANILRIIVAINALASDAQYRDDRETCDRLCAEWFGVQAAFAMSCKERGTTKKAVYALHVKQARAEVRTLLRSVAPSAVHWVR